MSIEELIKLVGKPYQAEDESGNYIGCFEPVYFLYPEAPKFKLPRSKEEYFGFALSKIKHVAKKIEPKDIQKGDLIVFGYPNKMLHLGVYLGDFKMIQTFKNSTMTINRVNFDNKRIVEIFRISEKYRKEA